MTLRSVMENIINNIIWVIIVAFVAVVYRYYNELNFSQWILLIIDILLLILFLSYKYKLNIISGIKRIDSTMKDGISPSRSLALCKNNIKFLGIAANKLLDSPNFKETMQRCNRPGKPMKFLLSHPDNAFLRYAARRAGKGIDDFRSKVDSSLDRLSRLKQEHGYNIEIRLYISEKESGPPSFRLFFIDDASVLVSYYVFGEGDGLQMPQIQISKPKSKRDVQTFYYAFEHYYDYLWDISKPYE
jgi:hypothetical protein